MAKLTSSELVKRAKSKLDRAWSAICEGTTTESAIPVEIQNAILQSINSKTITYRYVLPTQVLAKVIQPTLDSRSIQAGSGLKGAFDARSVCHKVIVPFDKANHSVLGGSSEPYLNNPLRVPNLTTTQRKAQKNKTGFDDLCRVVDYLEAHPKSAGALLEFVLVAIRSRLDTVRIIYPVPNRVSQGQTQALVQTFLSERTGGVRLQAVSLALFRTIGERFGIFEQVNASAVNAADAATGSAADLTCMDNEGNVVLAAEVKDRELRLSHVQDKLPAVREQGIRELLFVVTQGIADSEAEALTDTFGREFVTGQNIYVAPFDRFFECCLILFGESGRREFLVRVGEAIDEIRADLAHRQAWRDLLQEL